jgi:proteasome lid subunit RPN8/RPN11
VLIGGIDHEHRAIFIMLALASPPDSEEWPTHYIRGCEALKTRVSEIEDRTAMNLGYVGEWHSHPNGSGTEPSTADAKVFGWIAAHTLAEGKPPVMLIAGENQRVRLLVGTLGQGHLGVELWL